VEQEGENDSQTENDKRSEKSNRISGLTTCPRKSKVRENQKENGGETIQHFKAKEKRCTCIQQKEQLGKRGHENRKKGRTKEKQSEKRKEKESETKGGAGRNEQRITNRERTTTHERGGK